MHEQTLKLRTDGTIVFVVNGAQVHISRRRRGRLHIVADTPIEVVRGAPSGASSMSSSAESVPPIGGTEASEQSELAELTNAQLVDMLRQMGVDPPARANKTTLLELLQGAG